MPKTISKLSFLLLISIGLRCDNFEFPKSPYPRIETLSVTNISTNGATFQANITQHGKLPITNHGFVWGTTESLSITAEDKVQLGATSESGNFQANIKSGLFEGETYFVKAFVSTAEYFVYGQAVSFISRGSTPPVIKSFAPLEGTWGDTITINGNYFSALPEKNLVKFGSMDSRVLTSNDSTIVCIVPDGIADKNVAISLAVTGYQTQSAVDFVLVSPTIETFSPTVATFEEVVSITGTNFSPIKEKNVVKFNEHLAEVIESSQSHLKVRVPTAIRSKENVLSVTVNLQSADAHEVFLVRPPSIGSISGVNGFIGSSIQVNGDNFNPSAQGNTVLLAGVPATILNATKSLIAIKLPDGIYNARSFPIEVIVAEQSAFSQETFTLQDAWIRKADVPHGPFGRYDAVAFSINGLGYVGLGSGGVGTKFWRYDPMSNTWTEVAPFPGGQRAGATSFVIGDKAYVGLGGGAPNDFWSYDPQTDSWSSIADFPLESYQARGYSVNGKGYVLRNTLAENFWEYDPVSDAWMQMKDIPTGYEGYPHLPDAGFLVDDRLFIYSADATTDLNQLWEFDFNTNEWVMRSTPNESESITYGTTGFSVSGNGYIRGALFLYKYIPSSDTWINDLEGPPGVRQYSIAFVIDNKAYFGTSFSGSYDLWEFDPDYE